MTMLNTAAVEGPPAEEGRPGRKKLLRIVLVLVVALAAGGWWFMQRSAAADQPPQPGAVLQLEAIQVNLADAHYLRIGIALQATADASAELDGSKALDETIDLFSGQDMHRLASKAYRNKMKDELVQRLEKAYDGQVIGVYFTDFVTQ